MNRLIGIISPVRLTRLTNMASMTRQTRLPLAIRLDSHPRIARLLRLTSKSSMVGHTRMNRMVTLDRTITMEILTWRNRLSRLYGLTILPIMSI